MAGAIEIGGLKDLQRTFRELEPALAKAWRAELKDVAEPVRAVAEVKAVQEISNIGPQWSRMRVGLSGGVVYVAPRQRGRRSRSSPEIRRPNLKDLLLDRAMIPALEENEPLIFARIERMVDGLIQRYGD